jgi:hypothetical protein
LCEELGVVGIVLAGMGRWSAEVGCGCVVREVDDDSGMWYMDIKRSIVVSLEESERRREMVMRGLTDLGCSRVNALLPLQPILRRLIFVYSCSWT